MDKDPPIDLLKKHYQLLTEAMNDIKDVINTDPVTWSVPFAASEWRALVYKIEDIAANVSTVDLFNPHNNPDNERKCIEEMKPYFKHV